MTFKKQKTNINPFPSFTKFSSMVIEGNSHCISNVIAPRLRCLMQNRNTDVELVLQAT